MKDSMKTKTRKALCGLMLGLLLPAAGTLTTHAACGLNGVESNGIVTYTFAGALDEPFGSLAAGTPFTGSFSYAVPQPDLGPGSPTYKGDYLGQSISLTFGGTTVSHTGLIVATLYDHGTYDGMGPFGPQTYPTDLFHLYTINMSGSLGGLTLAPGAGIQIVLQDAAGTAWPSTALPGAGLTMADLTAGNATFIQLQQGIPPGYQGPFPPGFPALARGSLLPCVNLNAPPTVSCPAAAAIACTSFDGATRTVTIGLGDTDNDPLTVKWTVDNVLVATHVLAAGATSDSLVDQPFGFGPHSVTVTVTDGKSDPATCGTTVTVTAHDAPVPSLASLPTIRGECSASITETPTAIDVCAEGGIVTGTTTDPLNYGEQGTYTVTWIYTSPHDASLVTTQQQAVVVEDITPPTITCPPNVAVAYGSEPAAATNVAGFLAQGGTITDNCDPNGAVYSYDVSNGICPIVVTRVYVVKDAAGNASGCGQTITVNNLFATDGIVWHQPLARNGASEDTDPGAGGTLKYRFKLGSTIPIKIHAQGCSGDVTPNANVSGKVVVFGDTDMDGVIDANEGALVIDYNGVGEAGGVMDKIDGHLRYNLDTKKLPPTFKCYILQVSVTDSSTGESGVETVPLQAK